MSGSKFGGGPSTDIARHRVVMLTRDLDALDEKLRDAAAAADELSDERDAALVRAAAAESRVRVLEAALGLEPGEEP